MAADVSKNAMKKPKYRIAYQVSKIKKIPGKSRFKNSIKSINSRIRYVYFGNMQSWAHYRGEKDVRLGEAGAGKQEEEKTKAIHRRTACRELKKRNPETDADHEYQLRPGGLSPGIELPKRREAGFLGGNGGGRKGVLKKTPEGIQKAGDPLGICSGNGMREARRQASPSCDQRHQAGNLPELLG